MASFDRPVKVDANGNIDTSLIEKELGAALKFDVQYKQKDNMKKKAIKAAGDYAMFKAMVDCAHLKTVTSKEVESLGKKKQGWQKSFIASDAGKAQILASEEKEKATNEVLASLSEVGADDLPVYEPASSAIMEKDFAGLSSLDDQVVYLKTVGLKRTKKLLKGDCSAELLEKLLQTILYAHSRRRSVMKEGSEGEPSGGDETSAKIETGVVAASTAPAALPSLNNLKWLKAVSSFGRFRLTMAFVPKDLTRESVVVLEAVVAAAATEEERADAEEVLARFKAV